MLFGDTSVADQMGLREPFDILYEDSFPVTCGQQPADRISRPAREVVDPRGPIRRRPRCEQDNTMRDRPYRVVPPSKSLKACFLQKLGSQVGDERGHRKEAEAADL